MQIYEKLIKPIYEVNYLRAENVDRYRLIIRYFFLEYEKIHYWLHKEDIYYEIKQLPGYQEYTLEQCQNDLQSLVDWGNLTAIQDSNKVKTIEDFKNRKYRYQLNEYTVEIERMTIRLENLEIEGASLEPTLLERIYQQVKELPMIMKKDAMDISGWIHVLMNDFIRLNQNYQDYIKTLNSAKAEELMKTTQFLVFKDKLINYLRTFVIAMQDRGSIIAALLQEVKIEDLQYLFERATEYELSIPRLDIELNYQDVYDSYTNKWQSFNNWFVGDGSTNEMEQLFTITNEIVRKMTRYAQQIAEMNNRGSNRKEQYDYIAKIFSDCKDIEEAHCLSAFVFGVSNCLHLQGLVDTKTEDIHKEVYKEVPSYIDFDSHSAIIRTKYVRKPAEDYQFERELQRRELEIEMEQKNRAVAALIHDGVIDFATISSIDANTRKTILSWLSRALGQSSLHAKTEDGRLFYVDKENINEQCLIACEDGDFYMPAFKIVFKEL